MKFSVAWASLATENQILKFVILIVSGLCIFFGLTALKLALRDPLVIERSCFSRVANVVDGKRSPIEIESFLKEALSQRFDTKTRPQNDFLSAEEVDSRKSEQMDLEGRKLEQKVILNRMTIDGGVVHVDADRLIAIGDVRSAFKFPLTIKIESTTRSEGNPYGLIVREIKTVREEKQ